MPEPDRLRFSEWMARALHDPQKGYYTRQIATVGRRGDFSTSASTSPVLAQGIAHWLNGEMKKQGDVRTVIEVGGGDGSLSAEVRRALGWWQRRRCRWHMVELSLPLRTQQERVLAGGGVEWFMTMREALEACGGQALVFHNELLDALPVTLLQWSAAANAWMEVWLLQEKGVWREHLAEVLFSEEQMRTHELLRPDQWTGPVPLRDGQRVELCSGCHEWLKSWASHWRAGSMLTLDYGNVFPRLYHRRPRGSVRAYLRHQMLTGEQVYENMGRQDITADVNFTDLQTMGTVFGWDTMQYSSQREFLLSQDPSLEKKAAKDAATAFLLDEQGAGGAFQALIQHRT